MPGLSSGAFDLFNTCFKYTHHQLARVGQDESCSLLLTGYERLDIDTEVGSESLS